MGEFNEKIDDTGEAVRSPKDLFAQLRGELPQLATQFVSRVRGSVTGYEAGELVSRDDLYRTALRSLDLLLQSLSAERGVSALYDHAEEIGRRRARQQVPAESLTMAMQSDFSVIWTRLIEVARDSPETTLALAQRVEPMWRIVESFSTSTMQFYRDEELQIAQDRLDHRQIAIGRLLAFRYPSELSLTWVANELGCDVNGDFTVTVADQEESREALFSLASELRRSPFYFYRSSGVVVAFWPRGQGPAIVATRIARIRCAQVQSVAGLSQIPRTVEALTMLLESVDVDVQRPIDLAEGLPLLSRRALETHGVDLVGRLAGALERCQESERARLKETVVHYLSTGSVQETSSELFYHRNTVLKRLNRFTELTGIDVTVPVEAASVVLAWVEVNPAKDRSDSALDV